MSFIDTLQNYGRTCGICNNLLAPVICTDGAFLSVQCGYGYHCEPEESNLQLSEYESFEVRTGVKDVELSVYLDNNDENQFSYVPVEIIDKVVNKHGGLDTAAIENYIKYKDKEQ